MKKPHHAMLLEDEQRRMKIHIFFYAKNSNYLAGNIYVIIGKRRCYFLRAYPLIPSCMWDQEVQNIYDIGIQYYLWPAKVKTCLLHDGAALKLKFMQGIRITDDQDIFLPTFKYLGQNHLLMDFVRTTGRPRLVRELCPKKHRTNQNRTNQESTKILLKID